MKTPEALRVFQGAESCYPELPHKDPTQYPGAPNMGQSRPCLYTLAPPSKHHQHTGSLAEGSKYPNTRCIPKTTFVMYSIETLCIYIYTYSHTYVNLHVHVYEYKTLDTYIYIYHRSDRTTGQLIPAVSAISDQEGEEVVFHEVSRADLVAESLCCTNELHNPFPLNIRSTSNMGTFEVPQTWGLSVPKHCNLRSLKPKRPRI